MIHVCVSCWLIETLRHRRSSSCSLEADAGASTLFNYNSAVYLLVVVVVSRVAPLPIPYRARARSNKNNDTQLRDSAGRPKQRGVVRWRRSLRRCCKRRRTICFCLCRRLLLLIIAEGSSGSDLFSVRARPLAAVGRAKRLSRFRSQLKVRSPSIDQAPPNSNSLAE